MAGNDFSRRDFMKSIFGGPFITSAALSSGFMLAGAAGRFVQVRDLRRQFEETFPKIEYEPTARELELVEIDERQGGLTGEEAREYAELRIKAVMRCEEMSAEWQAKFDEFISKNPPSEWSKDLFRIGAVLTIPTAAMGWMLFGSEGSDEEPPAPT